MKLLIPLCLLFLSIGAIAQTASWSSLTKIDDEIRLKAGETALVVSVSEPIYLDIEDARRKSIGVRLRPKRDHRNQCQSNSYAERNIQSVSWRNPFPISGPCTIRLGTSALVTLRVISPKG